MAFFDSEMESMLEVYLLETSQLLEQLDAILLSSEKSNSLSRDAVNGIFRVMHTTKSSSAMMGLQDLSELAHRLEDLFDIFREDAGMLSGVEKETFDLVFEASDFIKAELGAMQQESYQPKKATELLLRIDQLLQKLRSGSRIIARLRFEKDCKMENIRAFMAARQIRHLCSDLRLYPEDVEKNPSTADYIRKEGFFLSFTAADSKQVLEKLRGALFVEECQVVEEIPRERPQEPVPQPAADPGNQFIHVRVEKLDELQNLTGELMIALSALEEEDFLLSKNRVEHRVSRLLSELESLVISTRMVSLSGLEPKLNRIVRDICKKEKKEVSFVIRGQEAEVDKNIVDCIFDPLMHLVRNAIDHGVEPPEEREALGKKRAGQVEILFERQGGEVLCTVSDDGRGIDPESVRKKARQKGLLLKPEESYSEEELLELCFLPGFSTRDSATEYSGRGVGLDVVKQGVEQFGGHLSLESERGRGTRFILHLPLSLTILEAVEFESGGHSFAVPAYQVEHFSSFSPQAEHYREQNGRRLWFSGGECRQILSLREFFKLEGPGNGPEYLICVKGASRSACLLVDRITGQRDVVAKPLPKLFGARFKQCTGISGGSVSGDGSICMLLDVEDLIRAADSREG